LEALVLKHLPGQPLDEDTLGMALYLDRQYWKDFETATANAICKAFNGK
jgi:Family of unknown function (DUF6890)